MEPPPAPPPRSPLRPPPPPTIQSVLSKRQHALHELMSSERAYASDLTLILEVHVPLAQGPMTPEDIKIIFGNIGELAELSDVFCEALQRTIGSALEDPDATDDHIGELFMRFAPELEGPYKQYITRHPSALAHLTSLPSTPELTAYHQKTRDLAVSLSHAWDLASLLIKPVQRLLKYSLLLTAIIDATALTHPDRPHLVNARTAMEDVARQVNEGRRRAEVVKEVLTAPKKPPTVLRIKSFRAPQDPNSEAARVDRMQAELARIDVFAQQLSRTAQEWARGADTAAQVLLSWAKAFALAIGLSAAVRSEAFDTFLETLTSRVLPASAALLPTIAADLLAPLARLLASAAQPRQLLASMSEHAPLHHHLLTMPVTPKNRPPPALLSASAHYLALRTQLAAELPAYLALLHRGLAALVRRLAAVQAAFFGETRDAWAGLWDMLRVEGERNGGGAETEAVWRARWADVDQGVQSLAICRPLRGSLLASASSSVSTALTGSSMPMTPAEAVARAYTDPINTSGGALGYTVDGGMELGSPESSHLYSPSSFLPYSPSSHYERSQHHNAQSHTNRRDSSGASIHSTTTTTTSSGSGKAAHVSSVLAALDPPSSASRRNVNNATAMLAGMSPGGGAGYAVPFFSGGGSGTTPPISGPFPLGMGRPRGGSDGYSAYSGAPSAYSPPSSGFIGWNENKRGKSPLRNGNDTGGGGANGKNSASGQANGASKVKGSNTPRRSKSPVSTAPTTRTVKDGGEEFGEVVAELGWGDFGGSILPPKKVKDPAREEEKAREKERERRRREEEKEEKARRRKEKKQAGKAGGSASNSNTNSSEPSPRSSLASSRLALLEGAGYGFTAPKVKDKEKSKNRQKDEGYGQARRASDNSGSSSNPGSNPGSNRNSNPNSNGSRVPSRPPSRGRLMDEPHPYANVNAYGPPRALPAPPSSAARSSRSRPPSPAAYDPSPAFDVYDPSAFTADRRATWLAAPALYTCRVVHPCTPPAAAPSYFGYPFFALEAHALLEVLHEAGHPGSHPRLPLYVDEGEDCLLLCRDAGGRVGWALASFLAPLVGE
ncbi:hypothetical protein B0H12DRAFT_1320345 [Mycena haematopus]|nr:hypothetical protein B0H12DRAFT_1320345 [Mycena haematopus]